MHTNYITSSRTHRKPTTFSLGTPKKKRNKHQQDESAKISLEVISFPSPIKPSTLVPIFTVISANFRTKLVHPHYISLQGHNHPHHRDYKTLIIPSFVYRLVNHIYSCNRRITRDFCRITCMHSSDHSPRETL